MLFAISPITQSIVIPMAMISDDSSDSGEKFYETAKNLKTSKISGKIKITGNSGWSYAQITGICTGLGISVDPYVIKDLEIDAGGLGSCILIEDSDVYFKIENCTLSNSGAYYYAGIYLDSVENGQIINNNCSFNKDGIYIAYSQNIDIINNTANNNDATGIRLEQAGYNTISGNTVKYNGYAGIYFVGPNNIISRNTAYDNGGFELFAFFSDFTTFSENNAHEITLYLSDDNILVGNNIYNGAGIYIWRSNNTYVFNNTVHNNYHGLRIVISKNNEILGNTASDNSFEGISLEDSYDNVVKENNLTNNHYGVYVIDSYKNNISSNTINDNNIGIFLNEGSKCNRLISNIFNGNNLNITDNQMECNIPPIDPGIIILVVGIPTATVALVLVGILIKKRRVSKGEVARYYRSKKEENQSNNGLD